MTSRKPWLNVVLVYLLLFVSGTLRFMQSSNLFLVIGFIFVLLAWLAYSDRKISNRFILYSVVLAVFLLIIHLYTDGSLSLSSVVATTLKLVMAYLILKTVGDDFTDTYVKVVVVLAAISLFGYLSDTFNLLGGAIRALPSLGEYGYDGIFYVFGFRRHLDRNNSIFYEPGAYQIFLNVALYILLLVDTRLGRRTQWIFISILLAALLTTFSTTGYLIFAVMFGLFLMESDVISGKAKTILVGVLVSIVLLFSAQFQEVIFEKVEDLLDVQDLRDRSNLRSFDALVDMEIFKRHVFGVGYDKYMKLVSAIGLIREGQASSNGITKTLAVYGLPFSLFLFGSYFLALRRLFSGFIMSTATFALLMMFFVGESYYVFTPFCLAIIAGAFIYDGSRKKNVSEAPALINHA